MNCSVWPRGNAVAYHHGMFSAISTCLLAAVLIRGEPARRDQDAAATAAAPPVEAVEVRPFPGVLAVPKEKRVELETKVCLDAGWLEQVACAPGTREYEALVVVRAKPSEVHAALLLVGYEPGSPGHWFLDENNEVKFKDPTGPKLDIAFRYVDEAGKTIEQPARKWIRDHKGEHDFPAVPWIFGGSELKPNPEFMGPGEHYVADMTGSIIGLVTFGDEVIGLSRVISDAADVAPAEWELNTDVVPKPGTEITLIIRPWTEPKKDADGEKTAGGDDKRD